MLNILIPMAGMGSRFSAVGIETPKPLIVVDGKTLAQHSIETLGITGRFVFITRTFDNPQHNKELTAIFEDACDDFIEVRIDDKHRGAAHSASFAEPYIDPYDELIITNCDQHLSWNGDAFMHFIESNKRYGHMGVESLDGAIVLYESNNPKNSFAVIENGLVVAVAEKQPISDQALIGVHYWKKAEDFFSSTKMLLDDYEKSSYPECYVSLTYNYLIKDKKIIVGYVIDEEEYASLGTPEDIERYNEQGDG